ncbi:MAG: restriction endonuclease subunit S [Bacteroidetes bacterium]|nr:restriction endonuclease subunit S [Bacteroidota bacterium]
MKQGWEIKSLGEIADVEYGFTDKSTEVGDYRYVRITDIDDNGELISTEKKYLKHSKEAASFLLQNNDLLMARTGATFAKVLLYEDVEPSVFASYLIRIKFKEKIDNKLYWYFSKTKSYWDQANSLASGAAQPHFNGAAVKQVIFSYPKSLPEQQRIVSLLDVAFAAIAKAKANAEQNLKNARELFESYLQGVFEKKGEGWEEKRIDEICKLINGRAYKKDELLDKGKYRVLRVGNFFTSDHWYYSDLELDEDKYCDKEDLLYAWSASFGPRIWKEEKVIYHYHIWKVIPDENLVTRDFLFTLFEWDKEKIKAAQGTGTTMIHVSKGSMENRIVPVPPLKEQQTIVRQLDALRAETQKLEAVYQKKIADLEELKKSILQKAFAGELADKKLLKEAVS